MGAGHHFMVEWQEPPDDNSAVFGRDHMTVCLWCGWQVGWGQIVLLLAACQVSVHFLSGHWLC